MGQGPGAFIWSRGAWGEVGGWGVASPRQPRGTSLGGLGVSWDSSTPEDAFLEAYKGRVEGWGWGRGEELWLGQWREQKSLAGRAPSCRTQRSSLGFLPGSRRNQGLACYTLSLPSWLPPLDLQPPPGSPAKLRPHRPSHLLPWLLASLGFFTTIPSAWNAFSFGYANLC